MTGTMRVEQKSEYLALLIPADLGVRRLRAACNMRLTATVAVGILICHG